MRIVDLIVGDLRVIACGGDAEFNGFRPAAIAGDKAFVMGIENAAFDTIPQIIAKDGDAVEL